MFQVLEKIEGTTKKYLVELNGRSKAEVWSKGAILNQFNIDERKILFGYEGDQKTGDFRGEFLFPFPNRLNKGKYTFEGHDYQFPINDHAKMHAIHGFHDQLDFECKEITCSENNTILRFVSGLNPTHTFYPFKYIVEIDWIISEYSFSCFWLIQNIGQSSFPFGWGWHPYFAILRSCEDLELTTRILKNIEVDEIFMPTGQITTFDKFETTSRIGNMPLDHLFYNENGIGIVTIHDSDIDIKLEYGQDIEYMQLFTPDHISAVAIEPVSSGIDAFNRIEMKPIHLPSGEKWQVKFSVSVINKN